MWIAKVWVQQVNVFADIDLKSTSLITLNQEKFIAELIRMERNANANYLIISLFLALKI